MVTPLVNAIGEPDLLAPRSGSLLVFYAVSTPHLVPSAVPLERYVLGKQKQKNGNNNKKMYDLMIIIKVEGPSPHHSMAEEPDGVAK